MSRGMVSFLAGMGTGYIKAKDKALEQERQAKIDARADWEHQRKVDAATKEDAVNAEMATAMNPVATGSLVTDSAGSNAFTKDADAAAMLADMAGAKNDGVMTQHATRVAGTAYTDPAKAAEATKLAMTPDAESQRVQDVYRRAGMRDKAMAEFTANESYKKALEERKTKMETEGVTTALGLLRAGAPEQAMEAFQKSGSIKLPEGSRFVQVDGTDMWTGKPGKIWAIQGSDGKNIVADVGQSVARYLGLEGMLKLDGEIGKAAREERKLEIQDRLATAREKQVDGMVMRLAGGSGSGGGGGGGGSTTRGAQQQPGGLNMDAVDKQLAGLFTTEDSVTGAKKVDTQGLLAVRQLSLAMPAASQGDATGAALQAYNAYSVALSKAGGDHAKAIQLLREAVSPVQQAPQSVQPASQQAQAESSPMKKVVSADGKSAAVQPKGRAEYVQIQDARRLGYQPAGRGNAMFGSGEILYVNPKTGDRKYASQLFSK